VRPQQLQRVDTAFTREGLALGLLWLAISVGIDAPLMLFGGPMHMTVPQYVADNGPWLIALLAVLEAGWLAFDGTHALLTGDYVTPRSGRFAGQLGPWARLVSLAGVDPRSRGMRILHVVLGSGWLAMTVVFLSGAEWGRAGMLLFAVASLWYLPFGTALSVFQIVLLLLSSGTP
jgi:hypothetical protein